MAEHRFFLESIPRSGRVLRAAMVRMITVMARRVMMWECEWVGDGGGEVEAIIIRDRTSCRLREQGT